jgi:hypothetical protein
MRRVKTKPPTQAEELGYQFKATDDVSSHKAKMFRTHEHYQRELFKHSQKNYHPALSASVGMRMSWSAYALQKEQHEEEESKFPGLGIGNSLPAASPYDLWRKEHPNEAGHYTWLEAFNKIQDPSEETQLQAKDQIQADSDAAWEADHKTWQEAFNKTYRNSFPLFVEWPPFGAHNPWGTPLDKPKSPDQVRGTKRVHGHMAQDLPTNPDSKETQLRAEDEEENGGTATAASEDDDSEDPYWTLPEANETEEMCARRIWLNCQRARYPSSMWTKKQLR